MSSKGVGRVLHALLGGQERMQIGNGEIVEFAVARERGAQVLHVARPHQG